MPTKPEAQNSIPASHVGGRDSITWAITTASQGHQQEAGLEIEWLGLEPGNKIWDMGVPSYDLVAELHVCPFYI